MGHLLSVVCCQTLYSLTSRFVSRKQLNHVRILRVERIWRCSHRPMVRQGCYHQKNPSVHRYMRGTFSMIHRETRYLILSRERGHPITRVSIIQFLQSIGILVGIAVNPSDKEGLA